MVREKGRENGKRERVRLGKKEKLVRREGK